MRGVVDALLEVPLFAWIVRAFPVFMTIAGLLSLVGLAADFRAWHDLLGGIDSAVFPVVVSSAILLTGLALLSYQVRSPEQPVTASMKPESKGPPTPVVPLPEPSPRPSNDRRQDTSEESSANLGDVLQRQLDRGRALQRNTPSIPGMISPSQPTTSEPDVDVWINRTRRILKSRPALLADFNYRPPKSPLHRLIGARTFEPSYKERLDTHVANLIETIAELRQKGQ